MESRGGTTGGASIRDFLADFAQQGYTTAFVPRTGGRLECRACGARVPARDVSVRSMRRVEGASDPADMSLVAALECPVCGARGTATLNHGVHAPPEDAEVLRSLHQDERFAHAESRRGPDRSLVSDTGWLAGPERG